MKLKKLLSLVVGSALSAVLVTAAFGMDSNFMERYYSSLEASVSDGNTDRIGVFIDEESEFGKELLSWIARLNRLGVSGEFDNLIVGEKVQKGDKVFLKVADQLTLTYPDEKVKVFNYRREYVLEGDKIVGESVEYDRLFPELPVKTAKKTPLEKMQSSVSSVSVVSSPSPSISPSSSEVKNIVSFLPSQEERDIKLFVRWDNPLDMMMDLAGKVIPKEDLDEMMDQVPPLAEGAISMMMVKDGIPEIYGAIRPMAGVDPSEAIRVVVSLISEETGDELILKPFDGNLKAQLDPLAIVQLPDGAPDLYVALWKGDGNTVLISLSEQGLNSMLDSASGLISSMEDKTTLSDNPSVHFRGWMSHEMVRSEFTEEGVPVFGSDPLSFEMVFLRLENELTGKWRSNAVDLFVDPLIEKSLVSLGEDIPFLGGKVLGFMAARVARIDNDLFRKSLELELPAEELDVALAQMTEITGLTLDDILDLLGGRISLVIGGRSRSPIGDVPGTFLQIEPNKKEVLVKVAESIPRIYSIAPPIGLREMKLEGWDKAYAMNGMASLTVAVGKDRLLIGALDYEKINEPGILPENLKEIAKGEDLAVFAISLADIRKVVSDIADTNSLFLQDEDIQEGIADFMEGSAHLDSLIFRLHSLEEGSLSVRILE